MNIEKCIRKYLPKDYKVKWCDLGNNWLRVTIWDSEEHKCTLYPVNKDRLQEEIPYLVKYLNPPCKSCETGIGRFIYRDSTIESIQDSFVCRDCFKKKLGL